MAGKALPILLLGGAALMLAGGKKKKKISEEPLPDVVPPVIPSPPTSGGVSLPYWKKAGDPPRGSSYDGAYWDPTPGDPRLISIRKHFASLKYPVEIGPWPMNELGPLGTLEMKNESGSTGKLGGGDDKPNEIVRKFQKEYNAVSQAKKFGGGQKMGGLAPDGLVGPLTLNGLRFVSENLGAKLWPDVVAEAKSAGYSA